MTGGGSGGHITPILAVAHELKQLVPQAKVIYIGQTGDGFADIVAEHKDVIDEVHAVHAGKLRRYHGEGMRQLLDFETMWLNLRDMVFVLAGLWQSFWLLRRLKPDAIFCKGGYIGVPVGLAAALRHIPYLTHDSDAIPGLANRVIARWAKIHAVALPVELYPYPAANTVDVGVPVSHNYQPVTAERKAAYRKATGLDKYRQIVLVTGGGLGAERLNAAMLANVQPLLRDFPELCIVHTTGRKHEASVSGAYSEILPPEQRQRVIVRDYVQDLYRYSGAADVIVARGGATSFAEFAMQAKPCIIIPNPLLTGGHQVKNAEAYAERGAIVMLEESALKRTPALLRESLEEVLGNPSRQMELAKAIHDFTRPHAARELAGLILQIVKVDKHGDVSA